MPLNYNRNLFDFIGKIDILLISHDPLESPEYVSIGFECFTAIDIPFVRALCYSLSFCNVLVIINAMMPFPSCQSFL